MENAPFGIENFEVYMVMGILMFFGMLEVITGQLHRTKRTKGDWIQEVGGFFVLAVIVKPAVVFIFYTLGTIFFAAYQNYWAHWSLWLMLPFYLLIDDVLQYWYHRMCHEHEFFWKLHRPHHQAEELGFFISYRNSLLYFVFIPSIWWLALITFMGGAKAIAIGVTLKQLVIISSHSTLKWDAPLYKRKFFRPLMSIIERIIVTPAFHYAHHGKSQIDGISDPNGNYGNMFSIWDQLFGSAKFTRQYPTSFGLENDPKEHWAAAAFYPFVTAEDENSELSRGYKKVLTATPVPIIARLEKGEKYLWCQCGRSKDQPFCDGSHHGSKFKPLLFEAKKTGDVRLCNCKMTKAGPYCDNSHLDLD